MGWLSKFFCFISKKEREGLSFGKTPCLWLISPCKSLSDFLRALKDLAPSGSALHIEGTGGPPSDIRSYLEARKPESVTKIALGIIWPRPNYFHMTITPENLEGFAQLAEKYHTSQIAVHLHVYNGSKMLLQWYDAFYDPFYISKELSEEKVKQFCEKLGLKYGEKTI